MLIGFLTVVWITIFGLTSDALALNFTLRKAGPNSVFCEVVATGAGNVTKNPLVISCIVGPPQELTTIPGLVVCGNPGKKLNASPGIQSAELDGTFDEFDPLNPKNCDKNGKCVQTVLAEPTGTQLTSLNAACPNPQWVARDFVPCAATITVQGIGECSDRITEGVLGEASYSCIIPNCEAVLIYNPATQKLEGPDFTCTKLSEGPPSC